MTATWLKLRRIHVMVLGIGLCFGPMAKAGQRSFELDPAQTKVTFTLGDVLHTVHGTFRLKHGAIRLDDANGEAGGELVVDATSGDTGSHARDGKMHRDILESQKYPEIIFTPQHFKGPLAAAGKSHLEIEGQFAIHGQTHAVTLAVDIDLGGPGASADTSFDVPYVQWGMKNPSTFILRVNEKVAISIHAVARVESATEHQPAPTAQAASH